MPSFDKNDDGTFTYSYYGVKGQIPKEYVNRESIDIYLEAESFFKAVKDSYKSIDLSGRRKRDLERFNAKKMKTAQWLRKQSEGRFF